MLVSSCSLRWSTGLSPGFGDFHRIPEMNLQGGHDAIWQVRVVSVRYSKQCQIPASSSERAVTPLMKNSWLRAWMVRGSRIPYTRWGGKTAKSRGRDLCYATKHCRLQGEWRTAPGPQATLTPHVPAPADQKAPCAWLIEVMRSPSSLFGTHQFSPTPFTFTSATIQTVAFVPPVTARALHTMSKCVILVSTQY